MDNYSFKTTTDYYMLPQEQEAYFLQEELLKQYFGTSNETIKSKIYIYKAIADIKWASWAFIQDKLSALDFDFYKYGALKYLRARSFIISDNWNKSLERIN